LATLIHYWATPVKRVKIALMAGLTTTTTALMRIAGRTAGGSRMLRAAVSAGQVTLHSFARVAHLLWLQITGVFFLAFALAGATALYRAYHAYAAGKASLHKVVFAAAFMVMFAWFGISSLWHARRRSRS
jgi:hypothetical protein